MDPLLLDNKNMIFAIDNELDINDKIQCFIKDVSQKISSGTEESLRKASESFKHAR
jgi:LPS O-antigen subunit length determinant protein (WzzB/FepE family)